MFKPETDLVQVSRHDKVAAATCPGLDIESFAGMGSLLCHFSDLECDRQNGAREHLNMWRGLASNACTHALEPWWGLECCVCQAWRGKETQPTSKCVKRERQEQSSGQRPSRKAPSMNIQATYPWMPEMLQSEKRSLNDVVTSACDIYSRRVHLPRTDRFTNQSELA